MFEVGWWGNIKEPLLKQPKMGMGRGRVLEVLNTPTPPPKMLIVYLLTSSFCVLGKFWINFSKIDRPATADF